jgi:folylpolyglutamate synthase/dihydrofolate synthase
MIHKIGQIVKIKTDQHSEYLAVIKKLYQKNTNPKLGLSRIKKLLEVCGFDRSSFSIVQVVGTNGKGSTVAFLESILRENGIAVGLFSSPHLSCVRERIRINGQMIGEDDFLAAANQVLSCANEVEDPSFFECILAMALWLFQKKGVSVVILEAGLGGRLDATSATDPDILGVSSIDLDHQQILGNTISLITKEKLMAARPGQKVVSVLQNEEAQKALIKAQEEIGFELSYAESCHEPLGLFGEHQKLNAGLALALLKELKVRADIKKNLLGLLLVNWPGRFEIIDGAVPIVLDGAHNPSGMETLVDALKVHPLVSGRPLIVIYGSLASENAKRKADILMKSKPEVIIFHEPKNPRAMKVGELKQLFSGYDVEQLAFLSLEHATLLCSKRGAALVISGSLYTVGELRAKILSIEMDELAPNF